MKEKLKNAKEKVKEFIKENKVELLIGAAGTLVTAVSLALIGKQIDVYRELDANYNPDDEYGLSRHDPVDIGVGSMQYLDTYKNGTIEFWIDDLSIGDMGEVGEKIKENFPDVTEEKNVWALLSISDKDKNEDQ